MTIRVPTSIAGKSLSPGVQKRFADLIRTIQVADPLRSASGVVEQAVACIKKTCCVRDGVWVSRGRWTLDDGAGPVVDLITP